MIYVIKGEESYLINKKLNEIINNAKDCEIVRFDGLDSSYKDDDVVNSLESVGLFSSKTLVIVRDIPCLVKKVDEKEIKRLLNYIANPIYESDLVLYTLENNFNEKLKIFKTISENAQVIRCDKLKRPDFINYGKALINQAKINIKPDAATFLVNNSGLDLNLLDRNIEVLKLYPGLLDIEAVSKLITFPDEEDVFNLVNALVNKEISKSMDLINKLLKYDDNILGLIALIANQLRFLYSVSYYDSINYSTKDIMSELKVRNDYRITKARETLRNLKREDILRLESKLCDLDESCKSNNELTNKMKLELFVLELI